MTKSKRTVESACQSVWFLMTNVLIKIIIIKWMSKKCFSSKRTSQPHITSYQTTDHMTKQKIN